MAARKAEKGGRNQATKLVECPLCRQRSAVSCKTPDSGQLDVACRERCGAFEIEDSVAGKFRKFLDLSDLDQGLLPYLRCHVRQSHERKEKARITEENWKGFAEERRSTPVKYKCKRLLDLLARRVLTLSHIADIDPEVDGLLVDAPLKGDFDGLVRHLVRKGYIDRNIHADSDNEWLPNSYTLTVEGRSEHENLIQPNVSGSPGEASSGPREELSRCLQRLRAARNKVFWAQRHGERFYSPLSKSIDEKESELKEQAGGDREQFSRLRQETREQQIFESIRQRLKEAESELREIWFSMQVPLDQLRSLETREVFRTLDSLSPNPVLHTDRIIALVERALKTGITDTGAENERASVSREERPGVASGAPEALRREIYSAR